MLGGNDSLERFEDRMLRGDGKKGYAVKRVEPRRKDVDVRIESFDAKSERGAFAAADPVALHRPRAFGPAGELIEALQQAVGIGRDAQEPLRQVAPFDEMLATPAAPIDDLLVGEHGSVVRTPIDGSLALIGEPFFVQAQEEPLIPTVILGLAGRDLSRPVVTGAQQAQLAAHVQNVLGRPGRRVGAARDRRILGRQTECVPAHWVQHVVTEHPPHACHGVADRIVLCVPDVQIARGIRQHFQRVVLGLLAFVGRAIE